MSGKPKICLTEGDEKNILRHLEEYIKDDNEENSSDIIDTIWEIILKNSHSELERLNHAMGLSTGKFKLSVLNSYVEDKYKVMYSSFNYSPIINNGEGSLGAKFKVIIQYKVDEESVTLIDRMPNLQMMETWHIKIPNNDDQIIVVIYNDKDAIYARV